VRSEMTMTLDTTTLLRPADEFGSVLSGRFLAAELRERVENILAEGHTVVIDLEGVETMSRLSRSS